MTPEQSFAELDAARRDPCLRALVASGTGRASVEEAGAEAFARAWASWVEVSRQPSPSAWVVRTAPPAGDPATEATARTLTVQLVGDPTPAEELPGRRVRPTGG